jgi:hypothetical protein
MNWTTLISADWVQISALLAVLIPVNTYLVRRIWNMGYKKRDMQILEGAIDAERETRQKEDFRLEQTIKALIVETKSKASQKELDEVRGQLALEIRSMNERIFKILQIVSGNGEKSG